MKNTLADLFQVLIGRLVTGTAIQDTTGRTAVFQVLIGRLVTFMSLMSLFLTSQFQVLIGRLVTCCSRRNSC